MARGQLKPDVCVCVCMHKLLLISDGLFGAYRGAGRLHYWRGDDSSGCHQDQAHDPGL